MWLVSYLSRITMMNFALIGAPAIAVRQLWQFLVWRRPLSNIPGYRPHFYPKSIVKNLAAGNRYTDDGYFRDDN
jgi:hypothetical protein